MAHNAHRPEKKRGDEGWKLARRCPRLREISAFKLTVRARKSRREERKEKAVPIFSKLLARVQKKSCLKEKKRTRPVSFLPLEGALLDGNSRSLKKKKKKEEGQRSPPYTFEFDTPRRPATCQSGRKREKRGIARNPSYAGPLRPEKRRPGRPPSRKPRGRKKRGSGQDNIFTPTSISSNPHGDTRK